MGEAKSSVSVITKGGKRNYRGSDIQYDIKHGFLALGKPGANGAKPEAGSGGGARSGGLGELKTAGGPLDMFLANGTLKRKPEEAGLGGSSAGSWGHERLSKSPRQT